MAYSYALLGGVVDHNSVWSSSGDLNWHEVFAASAGDWTVTVTPVSGQVVKLTASLHIRSGDGNGHSRLYHKFRIKRRSDGTIISLDSEANWEGTPGYGDQVRYFDASRSWVAVDTNPALNTANTYCVEVLGGDNLWVEVSYGSTLLAEVIS